MKKVKVKAKNIGVIGDQAHVEGGIHFHGVFSRLRTWHKAHRWLFLLALISGLLVAALASTALAGVIFPDIRQSLFLRGLWPRTHPKEREGEVLIVIANFHYSDNLINTEAHNEIQRRIEASVAEMNFAHLRAIVEPNTCLSADDREGANALADRYDASLVIWGSDTGVRVSVNFYHRKRPHFDAADIQIEETAQTQIADPSAYAQYITQDLPDQLTFLSLFALGQSYWTEKAYEKSADVIEKAVASQTTENAISGLAEAYFRLGWLYHGPLNDPERALADYTHVLDLDPGATAAYTNRCGIYAGLQAYAAAIADCDRALDLNPEAVIAYINRGTAYAGQGNYTRSISDLNQALELAPENGLIYYDRGVAYYLLQHYERAIEDYDQALALGLESAFVYNNRGLTQYALQNYAHALADYEQALRLVPNSAVLYNHRGLVYYELQEYEQALANYQRALAINPTFTMVYVNRGNVYAEMGDQTRALADYNQALIANPESLEAYNNRGILYGTLQDYNRAIEDFNQALAINPEDAEVYCNRGNAYGELGDNSKAIADFNKALLLSPNFVEALFNRGLTYQYMEQVTLARADYARVLEITKDPGLREMTMARIAELDAREE